ncbi:hypothetical protein LTR08_006590 [Meristemomyces frigidus]|nr:hypothetical protein LTR08_006590 [Meristemomyces frigidus]
MKRKFSFDIPRLKIGPSKADTKALRDHLALQPLPPLDSPPPTPKSVRPPLSPIVEAELRAACAYVLHNPKPSHVPYEEPHGGREKQQLDYAAIKESVHKEPEEPAQPPLSKVTSRVDEEAHVKIDTLAEVKAPIVVAAPKSESTSPDRYRYKPDVAAEDLFKQEADHDREHAQQSAAVRAEQLMMSGPPKSLPLTVRQRAGSHLRSVSHTLQSSVTALMKTDSSERPKTAPRTASGNTTGSTPQTDSSECPWIDDKESTAVTSVAITPARSKRTSSQALHSGSEASSMPKGEQVHPDWMRQELEKHKRAQEERLRLEKAREESETAVDGTDTTPKQVTQAPTPMIVKMPARKPVPSSQSASKHAPDIVRTVSRESTRLSGAALQTPSGPTRRSTSTQDISSPRSSSTQYSSPLRSESRQAQALERPQSRARSITRQVQQYVRRGSTQPTVRAVETSRPHSRSASVARQFKEYFRPGSAAGSRKPSLDVARPTGRSLSIDSSKSTTSDAELAVDPSTNKWQAFKNFHRRNVSRDTVGNSRPGTSSSNTDSRGRAATRDVDRSPEQRKAKPIINLNRDLPPLPGLDQWKKEESEISKPVANCSIPVRDISEGRGTPTLHTPKRSRQEDRAVTLQPEIEEREEIVAARMGSPTPPRSHKPSLDLRARPPHPTAPPPALPMLGANITGPGDFGYDDQQLAPSSSAEPASANLTVKHDRQRSKTIQALHPPELHEKVDALLGQPLSETPTKPTIRRSGTMKTHLAQRVPVKSVISRKPSRLHRPSATTSHTPVSHSRNTSDYNFARKLSMDSYSRTHGNHYQNSVEITATQQSTPPVPVRDKKWWQRMGKKPTSPSWMDAVVKSGSRSGVLVPDTVAGSPVVRY